MKKVLIFPILFLSFILSGCGRAEVEEIETVKAPPETTVRRSDNFIAGISEPNTRTTEPKPIPTERKQTETNPIPTETKLRETKESGEKKKTRLLGQYTSPIKDFKKERIKNIKLAVKILDGTEVKPGEKFSFNDTLGPRTTDRGFAPAKIFVKDKKVDEVGGGICQITTALFQAAVDAGMNITERHTHSQDVDYAEEGQDATVFFGELDFKFINTNTNTIIIKTQYKHDAVIASIYAKEL